MEQIIPSPYKTKSNMKNKYQVIVGNIGTMDYTNKKLAYECYKSYVSISMKGETRAANEPVTLLKNGEIIEEYTPAFIIKGPIDEIDGQLYWSNRDGWGTKEQADKYNDAEMALPIETTGIEYID
jgi:hypothetical protein